MLGFADGKLNLKNNVNASETALDADIIVLSTGVKPNDALYNDFLTTGCKNVWKVGNASATGKIAKAVMNGSKFAVNLP